MNVKRAGRAAAVLAAVCGAGLANGGAAAASRAVAWGTTSSAPAGARGQLFGVAAASSADVLAVGGYNPGQPPTAVLTKPYAEHWTGSGWSATRVPLGPVYPSGEQAAQLNGVAEVAPGDGWAVGTVFDTSSLARRTLAYHWDGTAWTRSRTPSPAGPALTNQLGAAAARATNDVWAARWQLHHHRQPGRLPARHRNRPGHHRKRHCHQRPHHLPAMIWNQRLKPVTGSAGPARRPPGSTGPPMPPG